MVYKFATQQQDYSDFSSGRVIYNLPGMAAFPVRLASEIFQRARAALGLSSRLTLYDPTCGGAYHLTVMGLLHGAEIGSIFASDIDPAAVGLAHRNLGLLTGEGLDRREAEIRAMAEQYGKASHQEALKSVAALRGYLQKTPPIGTRVFVADALSAAEIQPGLGDEKVHLVVADIPYGQLSQWNIPTEEGIVADASPLWRMLENLLPVLAGQAVVAIAADKTQKIAHQAYRRIERLQLGKRQVSLLSAHRT